MWIVTIACADSESFGPRWSWSMFPTVWQITDYRWIGGDRGVIGGWWVLIFRGDGIWGTVRRTSRIRPPILKDNIMSNIFKLRFSEKSLTHAFPSSHKDYTQRDGKTSACALYRAAWINSTRTRLTYLDHLPSASSRLVPFLRRGR